MKKLLSVLTGLALGLGIAASARPAEAMKRMPRNTCELIDYCLFESPNYCGMTYAEIQAAEIYYTDNC